MVALVESGKRLPSLGALVALAGALGVDLVDLVAFDVGRNPLHVLVDAVRRGDAEGVQAALVLLSSRPPRK
jgi:transcriptional regulator with XRE-family HTH domain